MNIVTKLGLVFLTIFMLSCGVDSPQPAVIPAPETRVGDLEVRWVTITDPDGVEYICAFYTDASYHVATAALWCKDE